MASGGYSVTITAVDQASKQIEAVNKRLQAIRAPVERVQRSLNRFADLSGISALSRGMSGLASSSLNAFRNIGRIVEPLAAITGAVSVAGMLRLVSAWAEFGNASANTARRIGLSVEQLQSLQGAAALSGSSSSALTSGIESLGQTLYDAVGGRAPEAVVMLNTLGISFRDAAGHARSVTDVLPELADKIASMSNPYDQLRAATALLGGAARDLLPFLQRGSAGMAEYNALAQHYGVMNQDAADAAKELRFEQTKLSLATTGLSNSIAVALAPTLGPIMSDMAEWIQLNRSWIATDIGNAVKAVGDYLRGVHWKDQITELESFGSEVNSVVQAFGGWKTVIEGIIALKLLGWVTNLLGPIGTLIRLLALIPGSGVAGAAGLVAGAGYLGYKGAVKSGTTIGRAAELGLTASSMPGSIDEFGNVNMFVGPDGKTYSPDEVDKLYTAKHPQASGGSSGGGGGLLDEARRYLGIGGSSDRASPTAADSAYKPLMDLIGKTEGTDRGRGYDETLGYGKYTGGNVDLQHMTLGQVDELQQRMVASGAPSSAVGRYQIIRKTLQGLEAQEHLSPDTLYSKELQDHLAATLLRQRGGDDYLAGHLPASAYQLNLSKEWASLPVPGTGHSFYPGQGAGGSDQDVQTALSHMTDAPANIAGGTGSSGGSVVHTVNGQADVRINLGGAVPPGTTTSAQASGDLFQGPPRIHYSMPEAG